LKPGRSDVTPARGGLAKSLKDWFGGVDARGRHLPRPLASLLGRVDVYDLAAVLVFAALIALVALTFGDYAISNDEEVQQRYGELIIRYYATGFADDALFHFRNLYLYGGLFDVIAVGLEKIVPLDAYDVRHLLSGLSGVAGLAAVWATARTIAGSRAGLIAMSALAVCGTWYGAMFNHTKDIPFAAAMMGAVYVLILLGRQLPRPRWYLVVAFGVLCGCALGIRVLGVFLAAYAALAVALYAPLSKDLFTKSANWRRAIAFAARSAVPLLVAFVIAYAIMIAVWPWAALEPLNPLRALVAFTEFNYPIQTVLAGHVYHMAEVPRWYVPVYVVIKLTLLLLFGAGLALAFAALPRRRGAQQTNNAWRRETALIAFAALFPLLCQVIVSGPADTGLRHFLFTVPPIAVLAGAGLDGLLDRLEARTPLAAAFAAVLVLLGLGWNAATLYRLHPDEYLFYNDLVGGLAGASRQYATDYWVNIMPEAVTDLEHFLDRTESKDNVSQPRHRYLVMVCGERLPFEKEADARLAWTRDRSQAEFFIAPTHMNCDRYIDGKVVATIERLGVVIGVVKDRRAIIHPSVAGLTNAEPLPPVP
jgi:Dolichyl-phosphate-mannose-protein mannosyltransferase